MGSPTLDRISALERHFGKGATYDSRERGLILEGVVPEWLLRARKLLKGREAQNAAELAETLALLHRRVWARIADKKQEPKP